MNFHLQKLALIIIVMNTKADMIMKAGIHKFLDNEIYFNLILETKISMK